MAESSEKRRSKTWIIVVVVVAILLVLACACVAVIAAGLFTVGEWPGFEWGRVIDVTGIGRQVEATFGLEESFVVDIPLLVEVENDVGSIEILGIDGDEVKVWAVVTGYGDSESEAERMADDVDVDIMQRDESHIKVVGRNPRRITGPNSPKVAFTLCVPRRCELHVENNVGHVVVEDIVGSVDIKADVGDVDVQGLILTDDSHIKVGVGDIQISLPKDSEFYLDARTGVGDIDCDFDVRAKTEKRKGPSDELRGAVGADPDDSLELETGVGSISIIEER